MRNHVTLALRVAACAAVVCLGLTTVAGAQSFENIYGLPNAVDAGARRVAPVTACSGGGFVAVGTTRTPGGSSDIYFVRTKVDGSHVWELKYDVGPGGNDRGQALAEAKDGTGFILGGTTNIGTGDDFVLIKVNCEGELKWAFRYFSPQGEMLTDLVEAQSGDAAFGTTRGDILVAGMTTNPAGNRDGVLLRVRYDGITLRWHRRYDLAGASEAFYGLTEARSSGGTTTGDVVGAGISSVGGTTQGYALRVNGNTGLFTAGNHIGALYMGPNQERLDSVVELRTGGLAGDLVFIGSTYSAASASDIYLLRTRPRPTVVSAQRQIGEPAGTPLGDEAALDGKEVRFALPYAPVGSIALTGRVGRPASAEVDAFLLAVEPSLLTPLPDTGRLFGDHGPGREWGVSLTDHATGLVLAGYSDSNLEGAVPPDPRDLYLVGTDDNGKTNCGEHWAAKDVPVQLPAEAVTPAAVAFLTTANVPVKVDKLDSLVEHCP